MIKNENMNILRNDDYDGCTKRPGKFLWIFSILYPHNYQITYIGKFMSVSSRFELSLRCKLCGCRDKRSFVSYGELIRIGFQSEFLDAITTSGVAYDKITEHLESKPT